MKWSMMFLFNSALLGAGLAMDAFSVSLANGLNESEMKKNKMCGIAGVFAGFQFAMPMIGWICVHTIVQYFRAFERFIPWIALVLLAFLGGKMLIGGIRSKDSGEKKSEIKIGTLLIQGIATSIDALSVGFAIAGYGWLMAFVSALIIAVVTFVICMAGLEIGKKFGTRLSDKAQILGGSLLIAIGLEIFITGMRLS